MSTALMAVALVASAVPAIVRPDSTGRGAARKVSDELLVDTQRFKA